jgi:hypothetical protein
MAEVVEAHLGVVDGVDRGEHVDQRLRARAGLGGGELGHVVGCAQDHAVDVRHHVERRPVHARVVAEGEHLGHRHGGVGERADHRVLARHVVGGREHVAERWTAEHPLVRAVADEVGEVGTAAGDQRGVQRLARRALDLRREPPAQRLEVDAVRNLVLAHAGTVAILMVACSLVAALRFIPVLG